MKENRSLLVYIVLSILTLGIYHWCFWYAYARDMNIVCAGDGRKTGGIIAQIVFSILTLGIYDCIWVYGAGDRIFFNCTKRNIPNTISGGSVLLWRTLGVFIIVGPFLSTYQLISGLNQLCIDYNKNHSRESRNNGIIPVHNYIPPVRYDTLSDEIPALDDFDDETQTRKSSSGIEIIRRGFEALEHSDFDNAKTCFNRALPHALNNPAVYIGLLMSKYRVKKINELVNIPALIKNNTMFQKALEYSNSELRKKLTRYIQVNAIKIRLSEIQ